MSRGYAVVLLALGMGLACSPVPAESPQDARFNARDTNHDGAIDMAEHNAFVRKEFGETDTDHDGFITVKEEAVMVARRMGMSVVSTGHLTVAKQAGIDVWDKNKDGRASFAEYKSFADVMRSRTDKNHDGRITGDETR